MDTQSPDTQIRQIRERLIALFQAHDLAPDVAGSDASIAETAEFLPDDPVRAVIHITERQVVALLPARTIRYDTERITSGRDYVTLVGMLADLTGGQWRPERLRGYLRMRGEVGTAGVGFDWAGRRVTWRLGQLDDWVSADFAPNLRRFSSFALPGTFVELHTGDQSQEFVYLPRLAAQRFTVMVDELVRVALAERATYRGPGDEPEQPVDPARVRNVPVYPRGTNHPRALLIERARQVREVVERERTNRRDGTPSNIFPTEVGPLVRDLSPSGLQALQNIYAHQYDASLVEDVQTAFSGLVDRYCTFQQLYPSNLHIQGTLGPRQPLNTRYFTAQPPLDVVAPGQTVTYTLRLLEHEGGRAIRFAALVAPSLQRYVILDGTVPAGSTDSASFTFAEPGTYLIIAEQPMDDPTLPPHYYYCQQQVVA